MHLLVKPYKEAKAQHLETLSLILIVFFCMLSTFDGTISEISAASLEKNPHLVGFKENIHLVQFIGFSLPFVFALGISLPELRQKFTIFGNKWNSYLLRFFYWCCCCFRSRARSWT